MLRAKTLTEALLLLAVLTPLQAQTAPPEFFISPAPSIVSVVQGDEVALAIDITCNSSSFSAVADCIMRPQFEFRFSGFPEGVEAQVAAGRIGTNTVVISASSGAAAGSYPVQVTVAAGDTTQVQTFTVNVKKAAPPPPQPEVIVQPSPAIYWESRVVVAKSAQEFDRIANGLGRDSWEVVSVITRQNRGVTEWVGFFKRPRP